MFAEIRLRPLMTAALLVAAFPAALPAESAPPAVDDIASIPNYGLEPRDGDYAVVIGIEKYRGSEDRAIPDSDYSAEDADLMRKYLISLGFPPTNIKFLTNDKAGRRDIEAAITRWLPSRVNKDSTLFFYYSGHGAPDASNPSQPEPYLVPYDADPSDLSYTGYSIDELKQRLGKLPAAHVILMLDSCFSGKGKHSILTKGARPLMNQFAQIGDLAPNMAVLTATKSDQISTSDPDKKHGILTYYFLKALRDGHTSLADIYSSLKKVVPNEARKIHPDSDQNPELAFGDAKIQSQFQLADPDKILEAKKKLEEENSQSAKLERLAAEKQKADQEKIAAQQQAEEAQRKAEEAQKEAERKSAEAQQEAARKLQEQKEQLERENAERQAEQQREFEAEKRRLEKMKKAAPQEEPAYVPPTF